MGCSGSKTMYSDAVADRLEEDEMKMATHNGSIATNRKELSDKHYWKDLLEPLDIDLRRCIIHYGEMAQGTYDAFKDDKQSSESSESKTMYSDVVADRLEEDKMKMATHNGSIATNWKELSGEHYWKDLLEPIDIDLRRCIIHYGEMAEATYDASIDNEESSESSESKTMYSDVVADRLEEDEMKMATHNGSIATNWKELSGEHYWKDLLDPLDINLRRYIIQYGEMAQATYDAFNDDKQSKHVGMSRYGKRDFFSKVCLEKGNPFKYEVTKFLYATSEKHFLILDDIEESNWIGYVAVATDEGKAVLGRRDIVVAWRGTKKMVEWAKDFQFLLGYAPIVFGVESDCKVHRGFYSIYTATDSQSVFNKTSARTQVLTEIKRLVDKLKDEEISITVTGHSLGSAIATLNAIDIVTNGFNIRKDDQSHNKAVPVTAFVFASPRVGNPDFKKFISKQKHLRILRITNKNDIVPRYPFLCYAKVGQELKIDTEKSSFLKKPGDVSIRHNLEVYLHGVAGTQGSKRGFKLEVKRDIALVNKRMGALKDKYNIPEAWWVYKNKGFVQQPDGTWKMQEPEFEDDDLVNEF